MYEESHFHILYILCPVVSVGFCGYYDSGLPPFSRLLLTNELGVGFSVLYWSILVMWKNIYGPRGGWILIGVTCLVIIVYPHLEINGLIMGGAGSV